MGTYVIDTQADFDSLFDSSGRNLSAWLDNKSQSTYINVSLNTPVTLTLPVITSLDKYVVVPIGYTFDGSGNTINITSGITTGTYAYMGLFDLSGGTIKKLNVSGVNTKVSQVANKSGWICREKAYGIIDNCTVTNTLNISSGCGGICGPYAGYSGLCTIKNCKSNAVNILDAGGICGLYAGGYSIITPRSTSIKCAISGCTYNGTIYSGGICGSYAGRNGGWCDISDCSANGDISGTSAGGICGQYAGQKGKCYITNCKSVGSVKNMSAGGICGEGAGASDTSANKATEPFCKITGCTYNGIILGSNAGGICGSITGGTYGWCDISDCSANGDISGTSAGGICGSSAGQKGKCYITNCKSVGSVKNIYAGGICGPWAGASDTSANKATEPFCKITGCTYNGIIIGTYAGGICGSITGGTYGWCDISDCSANGDISGTYAGGICGQYAGQKGKCYITNCKSVGSLRSPGTGGICGAGAGASDTSANKATEPFCKITGCTYIGTILGSFAGGICGSITGQTYGWCDISDCSANGDISGTSAGGICGSSAGYNSGICNLNNCNSNTNILSGTGCGGIMGSSTGAVTGNISIYNCVYTGNVYADDCGGIIAPLYDISTTGGTKIDISGCQYTGYNYSNNFGAIIGNYHSNTKTSSNNITVTNCYSRKGYTMFGKTYIYTINNDTTINQPSVSFKFGVSEPVALTLENNYTYTSADENNLMLTQSQFNITTKIYGTEISGNSFIRLQQSGNISIDVSCSETCTYMVYAMNNKNITILTNTYTGSNTISTKILNTGTHYMRIVNKLNGTYQDTPHVYIVELRNINDQLLIADFGNPNIECKVNWSSYSDMYIASSAITHIPINNGIHTASFINIDNSNNTFDISCNVLNVQPPPGIVNIKTQQNFDDLFCQAGLDAKINIRLECSPKLTINEADKYLEISDNYWFDGNLNTITIQPETLSDKTNKSTLTYAYTGLFMCNGGKIKNLKVTTDMSNNIYQSSDAHIIPTYISSYLYTYSNAGWISRSYVYKQARGIIQNCSLLNSKIYANAGGICGNVAGNILIKNCKIEGCVVDNIGSCIVGNYAGYKTSPGYGCIVSDCSSNCYNLCGEYAGIKGYITIEDCNVSSSIDISTEQTMGGICRNRAGTAGNCKITSCNATVNINVINAGGICGSYAGERGGSCIISKCSMTGNIVGQYAGGICGTHCGNQSGYIEIKDCKYSGTISGAYSGGITGAYFGTLTTNSPLAVPNIKRCYSSGSISGTGAGGICGIYCAYIGKVMIEECYSLMNHAGSYGGGIVGQSAARGTGAVLNITNCYNVGTITGTNTAAICGSYLCDQSSVGPLLACTLTNCYTLNGPLIGGGICSNTPTGIVITINDCYAPSGEKIFISAGTSSLFNLIYYFNDISGNGKTPIYTYTDNNIYTNESLPAKWTTPWLKNGTNSYPYLKSSFTTNAWDISGYNAYNSLAIISIIKPPSISGGVYFVGTSSNLTIETLPSAILRWFYTNGVEIEISGNSLFNNGVPDPKTIGSHSYNIVQELDMETSDITRVTLTILENTLSSINKVCRGVATAVAEPATVGQFAYILSRSTDGINSWTDISGLNIREDTDISNVYYKLSVHENDVLKTSIIQQVKVCDIIFETYPPNTYNYIVSPSTEFDISFNVIISPAELAETTAPAYEWYRSTNKTIWDTIDNRTKLIHIDDISGTVYYKLKTTCFCEEYSDIITIKSINPLLTAISFTELMTDCSVAPKYTLKCNITLAGDIDIDISGWASYYNIPVSSGIVVDGSGHTIKYINSGTYKVDYAGLFKLQGGTISNIFITQDPSANIYIIGGALVCNETYGSLYRCGSYGINNPNSGLCGDKCGPTKETSIALSECYINNSKSTIHPSYGLLGNGLKFCTITKCYSNVPLYGSPPDITNFLTDILPEIDISNSYVISDDDTVIFTGSSSGVIGKLTITNCYTSGKFLIKHDYSTIAIRDSYIINSGYVLYGGQYESNTQIILNDISVGINMSKSGYKDVNYNQSKSFTDILTGPPLLTIPTKWSGDIWYKSSEYPLLNCFKNRNFHTLTIGGNHPQLYNVAVSDASTTIDISGISGYFDNYTYSVIQATDTELPIYTSSSVASQSMNKGIGAYTFIVKDPKTGYSNQHIFEVVADSPIISSFKVNNITTSSCSLSWATTIVPDSIIYKLHVYYTDVSGVVTISLNSLKKGNTTISSLLFDTSYTFTLEIIEVSSNNLITSRTVSVLTKLKVPVLKYNYCVASEAIASSDNNIINIITQDTLPIGYDYNFQHTVHNMSSEVNNIKYNNYTLHLKKLSNGAISTGSAFKLVVINDTANGMTSKKALNICKTVRKQANNNEDNKKKSIFIPPSYFTSAIASRIDTSTSTITTADIITLNVDVSNNITEIKTADNSLTYIPLDDLSNGNSANITINNINASIKKIDASGDNIKSELTIGNTVYTFESGKSYIVPYVENGITKTINLAAGSLVISNLSLNSLSFKTFTWESDTLNTINIKKTYTLYKSKSSIATKLLFFKVLSSSQYLYYVMARCNNSVYTLMDYTDEYLNIIISSLYKTPTNGNYGCFEIAEDIFDTYAGETFTNSNLYISYSAADNYIYVPTTGFNLFGTIPYNNTIKFKSTSDDNITYNNTASPDLSVVVSSISSSTFYILYNDDTQYLIRLKADPSIGASLLIDTCLNINNIPIDYTDISIYSLVGKPIIHAKTTIPVNLLYKDITSDYATSLLNIDMTGSFDNNNAGTTDIEKNIRAININSSMLLPLANRLQSCLIGDINCADYNLLDYLPTDGSGARVITGFGKVVVRILQHLFMKHILQINTTDAVNNALNHTIRNDSSFVTNLFINNESGIRDFIHGRSNNTTNITDASYNDILQGFISDLSGNSITTHANIVERILANLLYGSNNNNIGDAQVNDATSDRHEQMINSTRLKGAISYFLYQKIEKIHDKIVLNNTYPVQFDIGDKIYFTIDLTSAILATEDPSHISTQKLPPTSGDNSLDNLIKSSPRIYFEFTVGDVDISL